MDGMPEQSGNADKFEQAMNICQKQGKKLRMGLRLKQENQGLDLTFDCIEKNE